MTQQRQFRLELSDDIFKWILLLPAVVAVVALLPRHTLPFPIFGRPASLRVILVLIAALGAVALAALEGARPRAITWSLLAIFVLDTSETEILFPDK